MKLLALSLLAGCGLLTAPAHAAPNSEPGEVMIGFRATGGAGNDFNYVVDLGQIKDLKDLTATTTFPLTGVNSDLDGIYGSGWHARTNLFWGAVSAIGNFGGIDVDPAKTLYATKVEPTNGTLATAWNRASETTHTSASGRVQSARDRVNLSAPGTAAGDSAAKTSTSDLNNWSQFQPGGSPAGDSSQGIGFGIWNPQIDAIPTRYLDLFRMTFGSGPGDLVGRMVLNSNGTLTFVPASVMGTHVVQLSAATYSAAENAGHLDVTVTRTGDTTVPATVTISTTEGTATDPEDYTEITNQNVDFAAGETSKVVQITVVNRPGTQPNRSFTVTLGGATGGTSIGTQGTATATITDASIPSEIALSSAVFTANQGAGTVTINFVRTGGTDAVTFSLNTTDDTAAAGTDFTAPAAGSFTIPANQNTATGTITLIPQATATNHRQFTITMASPSGDNTIGSANTATVRILVNDANKPTVTITSPLKTVKSINENASDSINITGNATDDKLLIDRVEVRLNGAAPVNATLTPSGTGAGYSFSAALVGGLNTFSVQAFDAKNNASAIVTQTLTYVVKRTLNVVINPNAAAGSTNWKATTQYEVGKPIVITAKANPGFIFDHWSGTGLAGVPLELAALNIVMTDAFANSAAVPTLTAHFVQTPFVPNVIGEFNGLVVADGSSTAGNDTNGAIQTLKVSATGDFTGTLKIDGISVIVKGVFNNAGVAKFNGTARTNTLLVARPTKPSYELALQMTPALPVVAPDGSQQVTGTLKQYYRSALISNSVITLDRAFFSATNPVPATYLENKGFYTVAFPARATQTGLTAAEFPQGDGFGSITLTNLGKASLAGTLADGSAVTSSVPLNKNRVAPLFAQLYTKSKSGTGSIGGLATFDTVPANSDVAGTDFWWFRPWQNEHYYPWGWPEGIEVDLVGTKYAVPVGASVIPLLPNLVPNATLTFSDGLLSPSSLAKDVTISPTNVVTNAPLAGEATPDKSFTLKITSAKGTITGTFTHTDGTKPAFNGAILQKGANRAAFGFFQTVKPKVITGLCESGGVSLIHK